MKRISISQYVNYSFLVIASSVILTAAIGSVKVSALYSDAYIEKNLPYGIASAYDYDRVSHNCLAYWSPANPTWSQVSGLQFGSGYADPGKLGYALMTPAYGANGDAWGMWLSGAGKPNVAGGYLEVPYGATNVQLQINAFHFWCGLHVIQKDGQSVVPQTTTTSGATIGGSLASDVWVKSTYDDPANPDDAADRQPQPLVMRYFGVTKVSEIFRARSAIAIDGFGAAVMTGLPDQIKTLTVGGSGVTSRYAFLNKPIEPAMPDSIPVSYTIPGGLTSAQTIRVQLRYNEIGTFIGGNLRCIDKTDTSKFAIPSSTNDWSKCADLPYTLTLTLQPTPAYNITPKITAVGDAIPGSTVNLTGDYTNTGGSNLVGNNPASNPAAWKIVVMEVPPATPMSQLSGDYQPCVAYSRSNDANADTVCPVVASGSGQGIDAGRTFTGTGTFQIPATASKGTQYCFFAVFTKPNLARTWAYDGPKCLTVGSRPFLTVEGGDIISGGDILAFNRNGQGGSYDGANTQLAALAAGDIKDFASGTSFASGPGNGALLSFANFGSGVTVDGAGSYGGKLTTALPPVQIPPTFSTVRTNFATGGDLGTLTESGVYAVNGGASIYGTVAPGLNVTLLVNNGNLFISNNINYAYSSLATIPRLSVYVRNGNSIISANVTNIHGVFVVTGSTAGTGIFYTCGSSAAMPFDYSNLSAPGGSSCATNQLKIFGSVAAKKFILTRTSGDVQTPGSQAETFHYSPEMWLNSTPSQKFDYYTQLPPLL